MRIPALPLIASIALFAAPALAQSSGATAVQPNGGSAHAYTNNANNQNQDMRGSQNSQQYGETSQQDQQSAEGVTPDTQRKLRQSLLRSGFRDVNVEPQTYVIHAKAPDGSRIVMMVGPDQISGVIMGNKNNSNNSSQANRSMQNGSSNWNHGGMNGMGNEPNESGQNGSSSGNQSGMNR